MKIQNHPNRLAGDPKASADIREQMKKDPQAGLRAAAEQFESLFMQMILKSMRDTVPQDGMLNSDQTRFYTSMLDQQLAQGLGSGGKGLGFAKLIEEQLGRNMASGAAKEAGAEVGANLGAAMPLPADVAQLALQLSSNRHLPAASLPANSAAQRVDSGLSSAQASEARLSELGSASTAREFVQRIWPHALEAGRSTGIAPQFLVAHAALESGWGKSEPRKADGSPSYNLFGIKAGRQWAGDTVNATTTEYVDGVARQQTERFRAYGSYAESFRDYARLLRDNPRYGGVIGSQNGMEFARQLQEAGYATDPAYAEKLSRIIQGPTLRQALIG